MRSGIYRGAPLHEQTSVRRPKQLAIATSTAMQTGIGAITDVSGISISFTVTDYPVEVEFYHPWLTAVTSSAAGIVYITDLSNNVAEGSLFTLGAAGELVQCIVKEVITIPGAYSRKGRILRTGGTGTVTSLANDAGVTAFMKATEIEV